ncbi:MAG: hypothetical protein JW920_07240 [Deltaproteobacteria bacterium]|nr:hypothetical protein [Deltaproteobacteria bacterium]
MHRKRGLGYILAAIVAFIFTSGFLGFCVGPDYVPASIEITSPADGTVFAPGTPSVLISGKVIAGDSDINMFKAQNKQIYYNTLTGDFEYEFSLDPTKIYSSCTFEVIDKNLISNMERVSYALGQSSEVGAEGVIDDAISMLLSDDLMDVVEYVGADFMNEWKNDLVYGWDCDYMGSGNSESPFAGMTPLLPLEITEIEVGDSIIIDHDFYESFPGDDHQGFVNLGDINLSIEIQSGNVIDVSVVVAPEDWVNPYGGSAKALFVQGHHWCWWLDDPHFRLTADSVSISGAELRLTVNQDNMIVASIDMSSADLELTGVTAEYGILGFEPWLMALIIDLVKDDLLASLAFDIPLMSVDDLAGEIEGIVLEGWPMNPVTIFTSNDDDLTIDIGLSAQCANPVFPELESFYATPDDTLPVLSITGDENVIMAISDDIVNELAFTLIQKGLLQDLDVTEQFQEELGQLAQNLIVKVTLSSPPVADFSHTTRIVVPNIIIDLYNGSQNPPYPYAARLSVDTDAVLEILLSQDGRRINATLDQSQSESSITFLYTNLTNSGLLGTIGANIANQIVAGVIEDMIDIEIPLVEFYGESLGVYLEGFETQDNCIVTRVHID